MIDIEEKLGEQPENLRIQTVATDKEEGINKSPEGSPLGKFKDSETLLTAYNELQSEFTRKCQKLSDAEKKLQEVSNNFVSGDKIINTSEEFAWNKNISEFLQSHKNAEHLVEEITDEIMKNEDFRTSPDGLERAYAKVIENKYIPHDALAKNEDFLNQYIYSNDEIKKKIIQDYVSSLQANQNPININNSSYNGGVAMSPNFKNLDEANRYVEKMFKF